jgi:tRNA pseudouridine55 synthase
MDAVRRIKRLSGLRRKVGHAGPMDPLARGLLPICVGQATRLMDYLVAGSKQYRMDIRLGAITNTYDAEGEVVEIGKVCGISRDRLEQAIESFVGVIQQTPPMYSAIKVQGQRLYKLARAGKEIEREARTVEIHHIQILEFDPPLLTLLVDCGRGVYMRSLAHDLGQVLGCGGYVTDLERLRCGGFETEDSVTLEQMESGAESGPDRWTEHLQPVDAVLRKLPTLAAGPSAKRHLLNGQSVSSSQQPVDAKYLESFRAYDEEGRFLALVRYDRAASSWKPIKVFHLDSRSPYAPASPNAEAC